MRLKWQKNCLATCIIANLIFVFLVSNGFGILDALLKFVVWIEKSPGVKYVLIWTSPKTEPIIFLGDKNETFHKKNCSYKNCYITSYGYLLPVTDFDAIIFHGPEIVDRNPKYFFPRKRSPNQSYIFASVESSHNYGVPDDRYNGLFNFTWTYRIDSDLYYPYMIIKDSENNVIGPNSNIPWINIEDMTPIGDDVKGKLGRKSIAAAWFVSHCDTMSYRENVTRMLIAELKKYNMNVDIYGLCGNKTCYRESMSKCLRLLQRDYYFYLAFENSFAEDYVTEKLLNALQNYAVPVVYGSADYRRFMPDGIYLSVKNNHKSVVNLVQKMVESIQDKNKYYNFFKWRNHYSYHNPEESPETDPFCSFCKFVNNIDHTKVSIVNDFFNWWNI